MNLIYANPITLAFHHLLLFFYGKPLDLIHREFAEEQRLNNPDNAPLPALSITGDVDAGTFDFIVVGGGSGGAVVASRLTEANYTVLLIEAGGYPSPLTAVPGLLAHNLNQPDIDWMDKTVPQQDACLAYYDQGSTYNRGRALGGGSNLNNMKAMRGSPMDFDGWAMETGDPSWRYENVLPYFKKLENYHGHFPVGDYHGVDGPVDLSPQGYSPYVETWVNAGSELGFELKDPNTEQSDSFFPHDTTMREGLRMSTHRAYIYPQLTRDNLNVSLYSHATKIELDDKNKATGVFFLRNDRLHLAKATKEIILSAGAIASPQILMLSGIGPEAELQKHGIPVKVNLPVGQNLQDHFMTFVGPFVLENELGIQEYEEWTPENLNLYVRSGKGPFGFMGDPAAALISSTMATPGHPDIFFLFATANINLESTAVFEKSLALQEGVLQKYFEKDMGKKALFILPNIALPKTRGEVTLNSTDPLDRMKIDPKIFSHPDDMKVMLEGIQWARQIGGTEAFKRIGARLTDSLFPGCEQHGNNDNDAYWECYARHWTQTCWHSTCTNRMGMAKDDPRAVVDSQLRVIGVEGLRVMDTSIMPNITTTNTNLPTIMIAEKGSDMIRTAWEKSR